MGLFLGLVVAAPVAQNPFFQVKITQGHAGGSQTGYGATISKQKVNVMREYGSSGEDVSVNAVIIPKNWWAIPSEGRSPEEGYCSPILRNDDRIHRYI